jgi:hypothetical protein
MEAGFWGGLQMNEFLAIGVCVLVGIIAAGAVEANLIR